ncbi:hypothetical protein HDV00_004972 [Rhizophlyctis rosea]|nr:hypothetical protein HDV00_004972 [Rhizophlyctis rosea]
MDGGSVLEGEVNSVEGGLEGVDESVEDDVVMLDVCMAEHGGGGRSAEEEEEGFDYGSMSDVLPIEIDEGRAAQEEAVLYDESALDVSSDLMLSGFLDDMPSTVPNDARDGQVEILTDGGMAANVDPTRIHCSACPATFLDTQHMARHYYDVHSMKTLFMCEACSRKFMTGKKFGEHSVLCGGVGVVGTLEA